jgi:DNA polymerase-3 subunit gamma/tau
VSQGGGGTIAETRQAAQLAIEERALERPLVQAIIAAFPGAKISAIRALNITAQTVAFEALPEVEDEWDPFEGN